VAAARVQPETGPKGGSGVVPVDATAPPRPGGSVGTLTTAPVADPHAKLRQRLTERIIMRFAAAGVYDLSALPANELRRIVTASVAEFCHQDRLDLDGPFQERLALEILAGMNR
jgi:hypothetical protein